MIIYKERFIAVSEVNRRGVSQLLSDVHQGGYVLMENDSPVAAVVGIPTFERLQEIDRLEEDMRLLGITLARMLTSGDKRYSHEDVLAHFGLDDKDLPGPPS